MNNLNIADIIKKYIGEDGGVPATAIPQLQQSITDAIGKEYVEASTYQEKLKEAEAAEKNASKLELKYNAMQDDFTKFKEEIAQKESHAAKSNAYRELLKAAGISEKRIDAVLRVSDVDGVELDKSGKIKGADKLSESIAAEWADFITTTETVGVETPTPPVTTATPGVTRDDILKIKDASERQKAIAENHEIFGF